jgi:hypothetical protein
MHGATIEIVLYIYIFFFFNHKLQLRKEIYELPEDDQKLRPKHVEALINK